MVLIITENKIHLQSTTFHCAKKQSRMITRKARAIFFLNIIDRWKLQTIWNQLKKISVERPQEYKALEIPINAQLTNKPAEVAEAFNSYFTDSVTNRVKCFSPPPTNLSTVDTSPPAFSLMAVAETAVS